MSAKKVQSKSAPEIGPNEKRTILAGAFAIGAVGVLLSVAAAFADSKRFGYSYLTGFVFVATIGLGALFFILLHHLVRAGWSVLPRRPMEWVTGLLPASVVLFLPVALLLPSIYSRWMGPEAAHDEALHHKHVWLSRGPFLGRAGLYLAIWAALALFYYRSSRKQDETGDPTLTLKMQAGSAPAILVFAITLTLASFDWVMSLDPHWYSTIFGVYVFSGAVLSAFATLALLTIALEKSGVGKGLFTVEHRHDIGKYLFGFTIFWTYIAFSQFILIWYANIPEETVYYRDRWEGSWKAVSLVLLFGHFVVPFIALLSRHAKRSALVLGLVSGWILVMHYVDLYWMVMPNLDEHGAHFTWIDFAGLLGPVGVGCVVLASYATRGPIYPVRDPRVSESLEFQNP